MDALILRYRTRTATDDGPTHITSGFYKISEGPARNAPQYSFEESKYVLNGQIDVLVHTSVSLFLYQNSY